jgi:hypothetical protein
MDKADVLAAIGRVRRAMPRNTDVMGVCDALERVMVAPVVPDLSRDMGKVPSRDIVAPAGTSRDTACPVCAKHREQASARQRERRGVAMSS